jgi:hypothetical protein
MTLRWAAYAAYANAVAALAQILTSGGDPQTNGVMGLLNNAAGVAWAASFVPIAYALYGATREHANIVSALAFAFGLVAFGAAAFLELSRAIGQLTFVQETIAYYPVLGAVGVWLLMAEGLAVAETDLPRGPLIYGAVVGGLWFFANVAFGAGGLPSPNADGPTNEITDYGSLLFDTAFLLQPFWGLWLGRALLRPPAPPVPAPRPRI